VKNQLYLKTVSTGTYLIGENLQPIWPNRFFFNLHNFPFIFPEEQKKECVGRYLPHTLEPWRRCCRRKCTWGWWSQGRWPSDSPATGFHLRRNYWLVPLENYR